MVALRLLPRARDHSHDYYDAGVRCWYNTIPEDMYNYVETAFVVGCVVYVFYYVALLVSHAGVRGWSLALPTWVGCSTIPSLSSSPSCSSR